MRSDAQVKKELLEAIGDVAIHGGWSGPRFTAAVLTFLCRRLLTKSQILELSEELFGRVPPEVTKVWWND